MRRPRIFSAPCAAKASISRSPIPGEKLLLNLVQMRADTLRKIGPGTERFEVRSNPQRQRYRSFFIVRSDGMQDDVGYRKLLEGQPVSQRVVAAMRHEIREQIEEFRATEFAKPGLSHMPDRGR
ncbi:DUF3223 domain-containing protein [Nocardiopsis dassonvillei]|uniref:DUF3223 domain-containing protein n=1 Tax=Nocardiopsis dassonvillei TaxID=2014 RepID=UPI00370081D0